MINRPNSFNDVDAVCPVNWQHPLNRGLYYWWLGLPNRSGKNRWLDVAKNRIGTLTNMDAQTDWVSGSGIGHINSGWTALDFDGSSDFVSVTDTAKGYGGKTTFTISAWCFMRSAGENGFGRIVSDEGTGSAFIFFVGNGADLHIQTGTTLSSGTSVWVTNRWYHFAVVLDGATRTLYINGKASGSDAFSTALAAGSGLIAIGNRPSASRTFDGRITDVRIQTTALTPLGIRTLYRESVLGYPGMLRRLRRNVPADVAGGGATILRPTNFFPGGNIMLGHGTGPHPGGNINFKGA